MSFFLRHRFAIFLQTLISLFLSLFFLHSHWVRLNLFPPNNISLSLFVSLPFFIFFFLSFYVCQLLYVCLSPFFSVHHSWSIFLCIFICICHSLYVFLIPSFILRLSIFDFHSLFFSFVFVFFFYFYPLPPFFLLRMCSMINLISPCISLYIYLFWFFFQSFFL